MEFKQKFEVTGVENIVAYDTGLTSTPSEKKKLLYIKVITNGMADNYVQGYHETAKVFEIPDRLIDFEADAFNTDVLKPGSRINDIEIGLDLEVGEKFKVAIQCGATKKNIKGFYAYELIK
jgi:hypothetical protein